MIPATLGRSQSYEFDHQYLLAYLAGDEPSFSTGAEFIAAGGETAGLAPA